MRNIFTLYIFAVGLVLLAVACANANETRLFGLGDQEMTTVSTKTADVKTDEYELIPIVENVTVWDTICENGVCRRIARTVQRTRMVRKAKARITTTKATEEPVVAVNNPPLPVRTVKRTFERTVVRNDRDLAPARYSFGGPRWSVSGQSTASHLINDHGVPRWRVFLMSPRRRTAVHSQLHNGQPVRFFGLGWRLFRR